MDRFSELPDGRVAYQVRHPLGPGKTHRVMTPLELLARLAALVPPPRFPLLRYAGVFAANSPWRSAVVPRPPDASTACHHTHGDDVPTAPPPPPPPPRPAPADSSDPLLAVPEPVPRTLSADHWRRLDDGRLLARQPRVDWATLLRRTWAEDVLCCPRCRGRMSLIEVVTGEPEIRRNLAGLGLPYAPASFAPARDPDEPSSHEPRPRPGRGPPPPDPRRDDLAAPPPRDEFGDPPWQDDCPPPPDDDTSQVPPDDEI